MSTRKHNSSRAAGPTDPTSRELAWVLRAAYGPPLEEGELPGDDFEPEKALALATALGLDVRLAVRLWRNGVAAVLGEAAAVRIQATRRRQAARALLLLDLSREVAALAAAAGAEVVLLKGVALMAHGGVAPGDRRLGDLDVLVRLGAHKEMIDALLARGFEEHPDPEGSDHHHAAPLYHPDRGSVEIHSRIPGVAVGGPGDATAEELFAAELCLPAEDGKCWLPVPAVMAAHAIAHARVQNRNVPGPALFHCMADVLDLAATEGGLEPLLAAAAPFVMRSLPAAELEALGSLSRALETGATVAAETPAGRLLEEGLAVALDPERQGRLWRQRLAQRVRGGEWRRLWRGLGRRLRRR